MVKRGKGAAFSTRRIAGLALWLTLPALAAWDLPITAARKRLKELTPVRLHQSPTGREKAGDVRPIHVRVYADAACRAGQSGKARFTALLKQVNDLTTPGFNVAFELESFRKWESKLEATQLEERLDELTKLDAGEEVDLVVGCTSPLQIETASSHVGGQARVFGKHMVLRPLSDLADEKNFREAFYEVDEAERAAVLEARARHKKVAFFVHEWAHTLGGMHERQPSWLLHPNWEPRQGAFSYMNTRVMEIALRHRLAPDYSPQAEAKELLAFIEGFSEEWADQDRNWVVQALKSRLAPRIPAPKTAASLGEKDPSPFFDKAAALVDEQQLAEAVDVLAQAHALAVAAPELDPRVWSRDAELSLRLGAFTHGEAALANAGAAVVPNAQHFFERERLRTGLPKQPAFVPPEMEAVYVVRFNEVVALLNANNLKQADKLFVRYSAFSRTPGFLQLQCEWALRGQSLLAAKHKCASALAQNPNLPRAHLLMAHIESAAGKHAAATAHLEQSVALDEEDKATWQQLALHYTKLRNKAALAKLKNRYAAAFNEPLAEGAP